MKIGIFVEYLYTAGGGERHICTVAEYLSKKHQVFLITRNPANLKNVEQKLDLDLSKTKVVYWPEIDDEHLSELTKDYDIFINSTIFSALENKSANGIAMIFFPIMINYNYPLWLKKFLFRTLDIFFGPRHKAFYLVGKYRPLNKFDWKIRTDNVGFIAERELENVKVEFIELEKKDLKDLISKVTVNGKEVKYDITSNDLWLKNNLQKNDEVEVSFNEKNMILKNQEDQEFTHDEPYYFRIKNITFKTSNYLVNGINKLISLGSRNSLFNKIYNFYVDQKQSFAKINYLKSYKLIWANSEYTKGWIRKIYNIDSEILYPPIDIQKFKVSKNKKNIIISVGRFFPPKYGHNKKQLELIKFFKNGFDRFEEFENYEYHLCGGMKDEQADIDYVDQCKKIAEGYPVFIHPNISFQDLLKLCSEAKIFWHAAGFGEDKERSPELFEHFGMTTVENMAAGAVPVAINAGGQIEIIQDGENGFRWNSESELHEKTIRIIKDEEMRERMSKNAIKSSKLYSKEEVLKSLDSLLEKYSIV